MGFFTLEQLHKVRLVISHGNNCPDGIASAMIVLDAYSPRRRPEIRFIDHGSDEKANLEAVPGMMFVDFSPLPEKAQPFIDAGAFCLDHHAKGSSVQAFVAAGLGVFGDEKRDPGICGATLAYEHVWKPLRYQHSMLHIEPLIVQDFARLAGIRDTWQKHDPDWEKACQMAEALRFWGGDHALTITSGTPLEWRKRLGFEQHLGEFLWARKLKTLSKIAEKVMRWTSPKGTRVAIFQGVKYSSDVAETVGDTVDLIVAYDIAHEDGVLKLIFSTRSRGRFDCGSMALAHGGGGHTPAAGFSVPMTLDSPNPYRMVQDTITNYEART